MSSGINKWTPIFGIDNHKGKRLPTEIVEVYKDQPLLICISEKFTISGTPREVFNTICLYKHVSPVKFQYIELFLGTRTILRTFSRKEVISLLATYYQDKPQQNKNYILMQL